MLQEKLANKKIWAIGIGVLMIILYAYWTYQKYNPSTDDAYIHAPLIGISAQVSGEIVRVYVSDNQMVTKGQALFDIDPKPFNLAVEKAKANLKLTQQQVDALSDAVNVAKANIEKYQALLTVNQKHSDRILSLLQTGRISKAEGDDAQSKLLEAKANLDAAKNEYARDVKLLGEPGEVNNQIRLARVQLQQAELDLQHTHVIAPNDGQITQFNLRQGTLVNQHQWLFSLVEKQQWWIQANFKETSMKNIHPKQAVTITVDMYPGVEFRGEVESIGAGSESAFSLFPAENSTGNWVKVTQRIPVKIQLLNPDPHYPLRIGASSQVTIHTRSERP